MKLRSFWCGVLTVLAGAALLAWLLLALALAGEIHPGFATTWPSQPPDKPVSALIYLSSQVDINALNTELTAQCARRADRHQVVVTNLQDNARNTQVQ